MATRKKTRRDGADRPDAGSGGWRRAAVAALLLAGLAGCEPVFRTLNVRPPSRFASRASGRPSGDVCPFRRTRSC
jgi:hypothetical protein